MVDQRYDADEDDSGHYARPFWFRECYWSGFDSAASSMTTVRSNPPCTHGELSYVGSGEKADELKQKVVDEKALKKGARHKHLFWIMGWSRDGQGFF